MVKYKYVVSLCGELEGIFENESDAEEFVLASVEECLYDTYCVLVLTDNIMTHEEFFANYTEFQLLEEMFFEIYWNECRIQCIPCWD